MGSFECVILSPLVLLYMSSQNLDVRAGTLKILLHVLEVSVVAILSSGWYKVFNVDLTLLSAISPCNHDFQRHGEKLYHSWPKILEMLRCFLVLCILHPLVLL